MANPTHKTCRRCGESRPASEFHRRKRSSDGLQHWCKGCCAERQRAYRSECPEKMRAWGRENQRRRRERDPEGMRAYMREWRERDPAQLRASKRAWEAANPERVAAYGGRAKRKWKIANPDKLKEYDTRRRALKRSARVGPVDLESLWTGSCGICGEALHRGYKWPHRLSPSVDHILPLSKGGAHVQDNLQWTHLACNLSKGASAP